MPSWLVELLVDFVVAIGVILWLVVFIAGTMKLK